VFSRFSWCSSSRPRRTATLKRSQIKLDEIIRCQEGAHNALLDLEELEEKDLLEMRADYLRLAEEARLALRQGKTDTGVPDVNRTI
jgi:low affinity Fe/Cu permease